MTRPSRGSVQKRSKPENIRRLTRRERLHQLRTDAITASTLGYNGLMYPPLTVSTGLHANRNSFEPLNDVPGRHTAKRIQQRKRASARQNKRDSLVDWQLTGLDMELSNRIGDTIQANQRSDTSCPCWLKKISVPVPAGPSPITINTPAVQPPEPDLSHMAVVKWQAPSLNNISSAQTNFETTRFTSEIDWSNLEFLFTIPSGKGSIPSPPTFLMTAAELSPPSPVVPRIRLPPSSSSNRHAGDDLAESDGLYTTAVPTPMALNNVSSFVAAKLPLFEKSETDNQTTTDPCVIQLSHGYPDASNVPSIKHKPMSTRCTLYNETDPNLLERGGFDLKVFMLGFEEEIALDAFEDEILVPEADWDDFLAIDDSVVIEHDATTSDWLLLSPVEKDIETIISTPSSAFSSMEFLPLPLVELLPGDEVEDTHYAEGQHTTPCGMAEDDESMLGVSKSA